MITLGELRKLQEIKMHKALPIDATYEDVIELRKQAAKIINEASDGNNL